jgi:hypothetical protein
MKTVYLISKNADEVEGRGPMLPEFVTTDPVLARDFMAKRPGIGGASTKWNKFGEKESFGPWSVSPFMLLETIDDFENMPRLKVIKSALAKLTESDKLTLGLTQIAINNLIKGK